MRASGVYTAPLSLSLTHTNTHSLSLTDFPNRSIPAIIFNPHSTLCYPNSCGGNAGGGVGATNVNYEFISVVPLTTPVSAKRRTAVEFRRQKSNLLAIYYSHVLPSRQTSLAPSLNFIRHATTFYRFIDSLFLFFFFVKIRRKYLIQKKFSQKSARLTLFCMRD